MSDDPLHLCLTRQQRLCLCRWVFFLSYDIYEWRLAQTGTDPIELIAID